MRSVYELWAHSSLLSYFHFFSDPSISGVGRNEWLEDEMCKDINEHVVITWRLLWGSHNIEKLWEKWRKKGEINHHFWKKKKKNFFEKFVFLILRWCSVQWTNGAQIQNSRSMWLVHWLLICELIEKLKLHGWSWNTNPQGLMNSSRQHWLKWTKIFAPLETDKSGVLWACSELSESWTALET